MSKVTIHGIVPFDKTRIVGIQKYQTMADKFKNVINENYKKLQSLVAEGILGFKEEDFGKATFCIYRSVNPEAPYISAFVNAIAVTPSKCKKDGILGDKEAKLEIGIMPQQKYMLKITHEGAYKDLSSAWQQADAYIAERVLMKDAAYFPFERYSVMAENNEDTNAVTEIYIPLLTDKKGICIK